MRSNTNRWIETVSTPLYLLPLCSFFPPIFDTDCRWHFNVRLVGIYDCQPIVYSRCATGETRSFDGSCVSTANYCAKPCGPPGGFLLLLLSPYLLFSLPLSYLSSTHSRTHAFVLPLSVCACLYLRVCIFVSASLSFELVFISFSALLSLTDCIH